MHAIRSLTLLWPGLPWLWLRGSMAGLVLALAFAVVLDVAIVATWIWTELFETSFALGLWAATAAIWFGGTVSALSAFPPPIPAARDAAADLLFVTARDAYLARDWLAAETKLRSLLVLSPVDGEAQLLLATLLRRVGRVRESRDALEKLARSDCGSPWQSAIDRELELIATAARSADQPAAEEQAATILALERPGEPSASREQAA